MQLSSIIILIDQKITVDICFDKGLVLGMSALQTLYSGQFISSSLNFFKKTKVSNCALLVSLLHQIRFLPSCLAINFPLNVSNVTSAFALPSKGMFNDYILTNYKFLTMVKIEGLERLGKTENALMIYSGGGGGGVGYYILD